uniref:Uncharacterized protein n=1 Tax=Candidatus Kentrum sp. SD TaxID=2126332 RepID=A0A450Y7M0_9GAMM|nr:MAG: hypothetical protein BECKSD772F_GA0070984_101620 [Candidatus Kentron sp. SD]VFK43338.1 MAG: hypothetical protein BECKSD772E_GA0070983_102426 [Candidatus Kentron sp. SD]
MITNELLMEKYQTQKLLDDMANHDLSKYVSDSHDRVEKLSYELGLKLKYGTPGDALQEVPGKILSRIDKP